MKKINYRLKNRERNNCKLLKKHILTIAAFFLQEMMQAFQFSYLFREGNLPTFNAMMIRCHCCKQEIKKFNVQAMML